MELETILGQGITKSVEAASKSAHKLAEKLVGEKRVLQKEVDRLVAGKLSCNKQLLEKEVERLVVGMVLNGRDKGTRMPASSEASVCVRLGVGRHLGKHLSSVVVYLDCPVVVRGTWCGLVVPFILLSVTSLAV